MNRPLIYEPMTAFTDLLIFALGLYFARELYSIYSTKLYDVHFYFMLVFLFMGLAGLFGALSHGIGPHFSEGVHSFFWMMALSSIGLTTFTMLMGGFYHIVPYQMMEWVRWLPLLGLITYFVLIFKHHDFGAVVRFYIPAMILFLVIILYSYLRFHGDGTGWIILSVLVSFAGLAVQQSGISFHKYFNHNDIYHVIQMGSMILLYKGVWVLKDFG